MAIAKDPQQQEREFQCNTQEEEHSSKREGLRSQPEDDAGSGVSGCRVRPLREGRYRPKRGDL